MYPPISPVEGVRNILKIRLVWMYYQSGSGIFFYCDGIPKRSFRTWLDSSCGCTLVYHHSSVSEYFLIWIGFYSSIINPWSYEINRKQAWPNITHFGTRSSLYCDINNFCTSWPLYHDINHLCTRSPLYHDINHFSTRSLQFEVITQYKPLLHQIKFVF